MLGAAVLAFYLAVGVYNDVQVNRRVVVGGQRLGGLGDGGGVLDFGKGDSAVDLGGEGGGLIEKSNVEARGAGGHARLIHKSGVETRGATHALVAHGALDGHEAVVKRADDGEMRLLGEGGGV